LLHALAWGRASRKFGERTEREFIRESAALANSLLLAHSKDTGDPELKSEALLAVQVLGSIGLEAVSLENLSVATEKLKAFELRELFRLGWSLAREVTRDAWLLALDNRIRRAKLQRNLRWLPPHLRQAVLEAEDLMSWRQIAATAHPKSKDAPKRKELLTWRRLCRLRWAVSQAREMLAKEHGSG
jgi:hypothetical protein